MAANENRIVAASARTTVTRVVARRSGCGWAFSMVVEGKR